MLTHRTLVVRPETASRVVSMNAAPLAKRGFAKPRSSARVKEKTFMIEIKKWTEGRIGTPDFVNYMPFQSVL